MIHTELNPSVFRLSDQNMKASIPIPWSFRYKWCYVIFLRMQIPLTKRMVDQQELIRTFIHLSSVYPLSSPSQLINSGKICGSAQLACTHFLCLSMEPCSPHPLFTNSSFIHRWKASIMTVHMRLIIGVNSVKCECLLHRRAITPVDAFSPSWFGRTVRVRGDNEMVSRK